MKNIANWNVEHELSHNFKQFCIWMKFFSFVMILIYYLDRFRFDFNFTVEMRSAWNKQTDRRFYLFNTNMNMKLYNFSIEYAWSSVNSWFLKIHLLLSNTCYQNRFSRIELYLFVINIFIWPKNFLFILDELKILMNKNWLWRWPQSFSIFTNL